MIHIDCYMNYPMQVIDFEGKFWVSGADLCGNVLIYP